MKPDLLVSGMGTLLSEKHWRGGVFSLALLFCVVGGVAAEPSIESKPISLAEARHGFATHLIVKESEGFPVPVPPRNLFELVKYRSPVGELPAYVSRVPADGKRHPAIIWIVGGFSNGISDIAWTPGPAQNDQSASVFWQRGIVTMYPSLRKGNDNPGYKENFYGEVDDVIAAADYLSKQSYVDPQRIYLGGHSTGGTLVLLVAECSARFRAVFSLGPVDNVLDYGTDKLYFAFSANKESLLRSPGNWLDSIRSRTFVFEGAKPPCRISSLRKMSVSNHNAVVSFLEEENATHFTGIRAVSGLISDKIFQDNGPSANIGFTKEEIDRAINVQRWQ